MYKPTTLKDIAKELGFSVSTISRSIADCYEISDKTKKKVMETAKLMNYKRNPMASRLKDRRSYTIGVLVSDVDNLFFSHVIDGIESVANAKGCQVVITQSHESFDREVLNMKHLWDLGVDGVLVSIAAETSDFKHLEDFHNQRSPLVFFDRDIKSIKTHRVLSDNYKGAYDATDFLIKKNCKNIAFLGGPPHLSITKQRRLGYQSALADAGLTVNSKYTKCCNYVNDYAKEVAKTLEILLNLAVLPDGIFAANESASMICLKVLKEHKLQDKVKVVGFSNTRDAKLFDPPFSCVKQRALEMGRLSAEKLFSLIESKVRPEEFETIILSTDFQENI